MTFWQPWGNIGTLLLDFLANIGENRNSLACLRNPDSHFKETWCTAVALIEHVVGSETPSIQRCPAQDQDNPFRNHQIQQVSHKIRRPMDFARAWEKWRSVDKLNERNAQMQEPENTRSKISSSAYNSVHGPVFRGRLLSTCCRNETQN